MCRAVRELYALMYECMIKKDTVRLGEMLDESFVLVHMTGMKQNKREYLKAIKAGSLNYYSQTTDSLTIKVDGDRAYLCGKSRVEAAVFGGGRSTWPLELDIELVKKGDKWLMTVARASTYR